jgi:hypothetical protein
MASSNQFIITSSQSNNLLINQLIASSKEVSTDLPFDVKYIADTHTVDLHTKKRYQNRYNWNDCVEHLRENIDALICMDSTWRYLIDQPMNLNFAQDSFPNSITIMPVFKNRVWMDTITEIMKDFDLTPVSRELSLKKFDNHINRHLPDENIVFFTSDDPLYDIADGLKKYRNSNKTTDELINCIDGIPFYVLERAFRHTDHDVDKIIDELFDSFLNQTKNSVDEYVTKTEEKLEKFYGNHLVLVVDIYKLLYGSNKSESINEYRNLCKFLKITPNEDELHRLRLDLHHGRQECLGTKKLNKKLHEVFEVIGNSLLNVTNIKGDTQLRDIGWHAGCQLALSHAFPDLELSYKDAEVVEDLISRR